jgi:hypothetical protein
MKKVLLAMVKLIGVFVAFFGLMRLLPAEWRENLSRLPGVMMGQMMENMPDE